MSGLTANYNFYLPAEGDGQANGAGWATGINGNFTSIDNILKTHADALTSMSPARGTSTVSTTSLAPGGTWLGEITLAKASDLLSLQTSAPATVRVYGSAAARTADSTRPYTQPPGGGTGLQFQGTTTASLLAFTASAQLANEDSPVGTTLYLSVQSRATSTGPITVTFTHLPKEI